jgi:hypothetical protein
MAATKQRHKWEGSESILLWAGKDGVAQRCRHCGIRRVPDPGSKSLFLFQSPGSERWQGYVSGHNPACTPAKAEGGR